MDLLQKIDLLGAAARYDLCRGCGTRSERVRDDLGRWIYPAVRPDGRRVKLLKVLQTNVCENDCFYCAQRSGRDTRRSHFTPDELARAFDQLLHGNRVEGLFLSSGLCGGPDRSMERMLATVELVRRRYQFRGYVHLKILPGAEDAAIEAAVMMADRVSVNLEAPSARRLARISGTKVFERQILEPLRKAHRLRRELGRRVTITSQFVVGAADESDREILSTASSLYNELRLARVYYSAFQPVSGTPLADHAPTPAWREHRLYQADFLLRQYGFAYEELVFGRDSLLPREADPKLVWARCHPEFFPVELNTAERHMLLRIPGIGPVSVQRVLDRRRQGTLHDLKEVVSNRADRHRAAPYVLLDGRRPDFQLSLWTAPFPVADLAVA